MVVSPCCTKTLPVKIASFSLSRTSSLLDSILTGSFLLREKPCSAFGVPPPSSVFFAFCADAPLSASASRQAEKPRSRTVRYMLIVSPSPAGPPPSANRDAASSLHHLQTQSPCHDRRLPRDRSV